jgi:hypothetical protein
MATATPAVSSPAKVAKVLISVMKLKPTMASTTVQRTMVRTNNNCERRRGSCEKRTTALRQISARPKITASMPARIAVRIPSASSAS